MYNVARKVALHRVPDVYEVLVYFYDNDTRSSFLYIWNIDVCACCLSVYIVERFYFVFAKQTHGMMMAKSMILDSYPVPYNSLYAVPHLFLFLARSLARSRTCL